MICPAPGLLSTVIESTRWSLTRTRWIALAMRSFSPPAPAPTTNSTLPSGLQAPACWAREAALGTASTISAIAHPTACFPSIEVLPCRNLPCGATGIKNAFREALILSITKVWPMASNRRWPLSGIGGPVTLAARARDEWQDGHEIGGRRPARPAHDRRGHYGAIARGLSRGCQVRHHGGGRRAARSDPARNLTDRG